MSAPLVLAEVAAGLLSNHRAGVVLLVVGVVVIVAGVLRLFRLMPSFRGRNGNPVLTGGVTIVAGLALVVLGIIFGIVR